jgi:simple sugar transport system substrate-binding protein
LKSLRKILGLFLTVSLAFSLSACNNGGGASAAPAPSEASGGASSEASSAAAAKKTGKDLVVGFAQEGAESAWRTGETKSIKEEAAKRGVNLKFSDAQQKQENQIKAIRTFIQQKVDVIGVAPAVDTGWEEVFKEAKTANIPVILIDRQATGVDDLYATFIGSDFVQEGKDACDQLAKAMGEKGNVVILLGTTGASAATGRTKGFTEQIAKYPNMKITKQQDGDFSRQTGKQVMESFLKSDSNIQGVFAENDDMGMGAVQAIEEAGKAPGKDIKLVGCDGIKDAFQAMVDGKYNASVECNPLLGPQFFDACEKLANGESVPKWIKSQESVYPASKAAEALPTRTY